MLIPTASIETGMASDARSTSRRGRCRFWRLAITLSSGTTNGGLVPRILTRHDAVVIAISVVLAMLIAVPAAVWWTHNLLTSTPPAATADALRSVEPSGTGNFHETQGTRRAALFTPPANLETTIQQTDEALVEVWCGDDSFGTGWVIETDRKPVIRASQRIDAEQLYDALVVTAWHVVEDCRNGEGELVVYRARNKIPAILLNWQSTHDVALLSAQITRSGLRVSSEAPLGAWTMTSGYPFDDNPNPVFGPVIRKDDLEIYTQMPIRPGHSGGPLVNSLGNAIGIITSVLLDDESEEPYGWAISTSVAALCERLFECPAGDIEGLGE